MKTKTINLYELHELPEELQQKVIEKHRHINMDWGWWEFTYYDFSTIAECLGITVDLKHTYFNGFYHQGQGSSFTAVVDVGKMIQGITNEAWKDHAPNVKFNFPVIPEATVKILKPIHKGLIDFGACVRPAHREASICTDFDPSKYDTGQCKDPVNIDMAIERTEDFITEVCEELNRFLFKSLCDAYDYYTSDKAVIDTIKLHVCYFTELGRLDND